MLKYLFIVIGILILLYVVFGNKAAGSNPPAPSPCPETFTIKPVGGIAGLTSTTYSIVGGKYYSKTSAGIGGYSGSLAPKEITKEDFLAACKVFQTPPTGPNPA